MFVVIDKLQFFFYNSFSNQNNNGEDLKLNGS